MGLTIRFDARALADLIEIRNYLVERSPSGAERVRLHLVDTIDRLADFPFLGRATDEPGIRVMVLTRYPYLVFYAVIGDEVVILHVRHGAREPVDPSTL
jgi:plasmid stabilization system protein ParE